MLRLDLSTRPFYSEGLVRVGLVVTALVLLLGLALSGREVVRLTGERRSLTAHIGAAEQALATVGASRRDLEAKARRSDLEALRNSAAEANEVVAARVFSWTSLLNDVAGQLPPGVRLVAVKPTRSETETKVAMIVRGRSNADVEQFLTRLEETGRFKDGLVNDGELEDDGTLRLTLSIEYTSPAGVGVEAAPPAGEALR